jgi:protein-disulfide isomerase
MASRREQKEMARARAAAERAASAASARRRRLLGFAGIVTVAVITLVAVIAIGATASGPGSSGLLSGRRAASTYHRVEAELSGIPQHGLELGSPHARVTMTYIGDLECPYCRAFTTTVLPQFISRYVRRGRVRMVYRSLCTATCHLNTARFIPQQVAAYAAGEQNLFWQYAELFYREQGDETQPYPTERYLRGLAGQIPNLDFARWLSDRRAPALASQVQRGQALTSRQGIPEQTPEVLMSGPRGSVYVPANGIPTLTWLIGAVAKVS